ncbi:MAG: Asp-tRNA(Asn)/Glu-tRNA(Gln) amidotransferase subunit GatC [Cyclobacteriaceae bacterium]|nr:Asp-tRNA(Asn)/Glu-tRNA(Gln) amidotransferase subunit GatC [Cyclobacteriaceae bacterium]
MKVDKDTFDKIAHLSRLEFTGAEAEQMMEEMTRIISWVEKLRELDTEGVEPLVTMSHEINALREDKTASHLARDKALKNAPKSDGSFFRVPKVIE